MTRKLLAIFVLLNVITQLAQAQTPVANFSANNISGCAPLTVTFKDESTGNPTFWNWDFGGGNLSNIQNPTITFANPGTYSVTLIVRNANGTNGTTKTNYITVNPSPKAQFTVDKTVACLPGFIQFTDASDPVAGSIASWEWDFGDGTKSTDRNPRHEYTAVGFYSVTLKVVSSTGCQNVISYGRLIRIVSGVAPEFSFSSPATCRAPFNVDFKNLTSGPGTMTYQWNFGNSGSSTQENPTTTYTAGGSYTVTLNATSEFGCSNSIQKVVDISGTGTSFNGPDTICVNTSAAFTNAATTVVGTTWDFGNGEQATTKDGASTYNTAGIFTVKMINTYDNCKDSALKPLVVIDKPAVDFNAPATTACQGPLTVDFQAAAPNAVDWQWNFGDGQVGTGANPSHTYANLGQYDVTLTITTRQGCTNTLTKPAFVRILTPVVGFSNAPTGDCIPFTYTPIASATSVEPVTRYDWIYGDGFTATTTGPTGPAHTYNTAGNFTLRVTITTAGGCTAAQEVVAGVRTGVPPAVDFSINVANACASDAIQFTFIPTGTEPVDEWKWDFGDGNTSDEKDPQHRFADSGVFNVTLTGLNNKCPSPGVTKQVHIKPPIALFRTDINCANGLTVNFIDESKIDVANYGPVTYTWDFGDGNTSNASGSIGHTYAQPGTYATSLTVTSTAAGGCSHKFEKVVELPGQQADFTVTPATVCRNELFTMTAINNDPTKITGFDWAFGNEPFFVGGISVTTKLPDAGVYDITLRITDINGCTSVKRVPNAITITGPAANFAPAVTGACADKDVTFTDLTTSLATIQSWTFDFGDGTSKTFTAAPFTHRYTNAGKYPVKLTVTDANNCSDTYESTDTVFINKPQAGFSGDFTTICPDTDLPFTDTSAGNATSWRWDFGDGGSATVQSPIHRYLATSGTYSVKLVITDALGCQDSVTKQDYITVKKPVPGFTAIDTSSICPLLETSFTFAGSDHESYYWDFGDGSTSTLLNPKHFYNTYGAYEAKLYVVGYGGCLDSASKIINVFNPFTSTDINYSPITNCNSLMVDFAITTPAATKFTFFYGDGVIDNSQVKNFQHFYSQPGFYPPSLLLQDSLGCQVNVGGPNTIRIIGALPLFGVDKKTFCDQGTVNFTNYTIGNDPITSDSWDFGDGNTSTDLSPTHQFTSPGTFVVKHNVTTQQGCQNTVTDTIRVYATPDPRITGDTIACINEALNLQATLVVPDTAITWKWDLGSNGQSANENVSVKYTQSGNYTVGLEASNKLGCKGNTTRTLYVPPAPVITATGGNNITLPVGIGVTLPMTYSDGVASYTWTPARDLSCTNCATPVANPKFTTTYNVLVEDNYGCTATAGITVNVVCNKENYFVPNTFSPNNDGQNDVFMPRGRSIDRVSRMQIFNRWGEMVFERRNFAVNDKAAGWDGTYKGKPAVADVYVYVIEFVCDNASVIPFRGNVTLLR